jgi:predicted amidohydrolase
LWTTENWELIFCFVLKGGFVLPPQKFRVGLVQMSMTSDPDKNLQHAIDRVREAASLGAQIVCLPELFQTQYFCQREDASLFDLAEPIPGPTSEKLADVAKQLRIVLIASLFEKRAAGVYHNTAAMFDADGTLRGLYRKMHIPDDPLYYEKYYFTPGDLGFRAFDTNVGRVGTLVCWDQWYPEGARLTALQGAMCFSIPPRLDGIPPRRPSLEWLNTMRGVRFSELMRSPMACMWPWSTASALKPGTFAESRLREPGWNSGVGHSCVTPSAE